MAKLFSSFDLSSVQISFVGLIGDFAVWAITDLTTGDIEYIIDDSGGSIVEDFTAYKLGKYLRLTIEYEP